MTLANDTTLSWLILGIFVDTNNTLYALARNCQEIQIWPEGSVIPSRTLNPINTWARSIFVTNNGDIYVDDASSPNNVYRWIANAGTQVVVMVVPNSCFGLLIDVREKIYCSAGYLHNAVRKSFMDPINVTTVIARNGMAGSALNQLDVPQGLFVDFDLNLYVADRDNHRIQKFLLARNTCSEYDIAQV